MSIKLKNRNTISNIDFDKIRKITEITSQLKTEANLYPRTRNFSCNFDDLHIKKIVEKSTNLLTEEGFSNKFTSSIRNLIPNSSGSKTKKLKIKKSSGSVNLFNTGSANLINTINEKNLQI